MMTWLLWCFWLLGDYRIIAFFGKVTSHHSGYLRRDFCKTLIMRLIAVLGHGSHQSHQDIQDEGRQTAGRIARTWRVRGT